MLYGLSFDKCSSVSHDLLVCLPHNFFLNLFYFYPVYIFFIIFLNTLFWATKLKKIRKMSGIGIEYFLMITKCHICNINSIRFCALDCHTNRKDYPWCKNWTSFIMMCTLISYRKNIKLFQKRLFIAYILSAVSVFSLWNIHIAFAFNVIHTILIHGSDSFRPRASTWGKLDSSLSLWFLPLITRERTCSELGTYELMNTFQYMMSLRKVSLSPSYCRLVTETWLRKVAFIEFCAGLVSCDVGVTSAGSTAFHPPAQPLRPPGTKPPEERSRTIFCKLFSVIRTMQCRYYTMQCNDMQYHTIQCNTKPPEERIRTIFCKIFSMC